MKSKGRTIIESVGILVFFLAIGVWMWQSMGHIFFIFNFGYIGLSVATGSLIWGLLPKQKKVWGRRIAQLMVGLYMLGVLGFLARENMQIEGFFFYLFAGFFAGATIHYFIAKIAGPLFFGRAWCGWACWTAMVLDFLPWSKPAEGRIRNAGLFRYVHFAVSLGLVAVFWIFLKQRDFGQQTMTELVWLVVGNAIYDVLAILLAWSLKDNRAFCKYVCPIPILMKVGSRFALLKIRIDPVKCNACGLCEQACPMNIRLLAYSEAGKRVTSTECIFCQNCINVCARDAVESTFRLDAGLKEHIGYRDDV